MDGESKCIFLNFTSSVSKEIQYCKIDVKMERILLVMTLNDDWGEIVPPRRTIVRGVQKVFHARISLINACSHK